MQVFIIFHNVVYLSLGVFMEMKGKKVSLLGQIVAVVWVSGWCAFKFVSGGIANVEINDIILSGVAVAGCFSPVYLSIILDKIKDIRFGDKKNE